MAHRGRRHLTASSGTTTVEEDLMDGMDHTGDVPAGDVTAGRSRTAGTEEGRWLLEHRRLLERSEAEMLLRLAAFDRDQLWALDGALSCPAWMVWQLGMARSTAFEKVRIAHQLDRRPVVADAFREGRLSYSMVRAITRLLKPTAEVDEAMVELAASGRATIVDVERMVRTYELYADQERPPADDRPAVRNVSIRRHTDGTGRIVVDLTDVETEEFAAVLQAFLDQRYRQKPVDESPAGDCVAEGGLGPVDESPMGDCVAEGGPGPVDESPMGDCVAEGGLGPVDESPMGDCGAVDGATRSATKADAFLDLVTAARGAAGSGQAAGDDRYMVHYVTRDGGRSLTRLDGSPVYPADASAICCDASTVTHRVGPGGGLLDLGRKTREWSTPQRRAISVRDGGHCRFPGCWNTYYDIHHIDHWEDGGPTSVANGVCECRRHHRLLHSGYSVEGDPGGELRFYRPDGGYVGSTWPAQPGCPGLRRSATATATA